MQIFNLEVAQPLMALLVMSGNNVELFYLEGSIPDTADDALDSTQFLPTLTVYQPPNKPTIVRIT